MKYYIYILTNANRTVLYTGVTNDVLRRLEEHRNVDGCELHFAAQYACRHLLYYEVFSDIRNAIAREKEIKGWRREKKEALIMQTNPYLKFLEDDL